MAKTYQQLIQEADALRARAEMLKKKEALGVVAKIRIAIAHYGLTAADLGLETSSSIASVKKGKAHTGVTSGKVATPRGRPKYEDSNGRSWSGMGPRPAWIKAAIAAGKSLEDFRTETTDAAAKSPARANATGEPKSKSKSKLPVKYRDSAGNEWSGRGSTPRWVRAAAAEGKSLEQLAV